MLAAGPGEGGERWQGGEGRRSELETQKMIMILTVI